MAKSESFRASDIVNYFEEIELMKILRDVTVL